jgi:hypothetical protein
MHRLTLLVLPLLASACVADGVVNTPIPIYEAGPATTFEASSPDAGDASNDAPADVVPDVLPDVVADAPGEGSVDAGGDAGGDAAGDASHD